MPYTIQFSAHKAFKPYPATTSFFVTTQPAPLKVYPFMNMDSLDFTEFLKTPQGSQDAETFSFAAHNAQFVKAGPIAAIELASLW